MFAVGIKTENDAKFEIAEPNSLPSCSDLENACHTLVPLRCVHDEAPYKSTFTLPKLYQVIGTHEVDKA